MAAAPMPDQSPQQDPAAAGGAAPAGGGDQQANSLQTMLAKLMQVTQQLGQQNEIIQPDMQDAAGAFRKAFLKTVQNAGQPAAQPPSSPGPQGA